VLFYGAALVVCPAVADETTILFNVTIAYILYFYVCLMYNKAKLKKIHVKTRQRRYNVELLKNAETKQDYCTMLQEKAANIDDSSTIMWSDIKEAYTSTAKKVLGYKQKQQRAPWITKEVLELSDERKRLKAVINRSVREVQTRLYHHT